MVVMAVMIVAEEEDKEEDGRGGQRKGWPLLGEGDVEDKLLGQGEETEREGVDVKME